MGLDLRSNWNPGLGHPRDDLFSQSISSLSGYSIFFLSHQTGFLQLLPTLLKLYICMVLKMDKVSFSVLDLQFSGKESDWIRCPFMDHPQPALPRNGVTFF